MMICSIHGSTASFTSRSGAGSPERMAFIPSDGSGVQRRRTFTREPQDRSMLPPNEARKRLAIGRHRPL